MGLSADEAYWLLTVETHETGDFPSSKFPRIDWGLSLTIGRVVIQA